MAEKIYRKCTLCGVQFEVQSKTGADNMAFWEGACPRCGLNRQGFRAPEECRPGERVIPGMVYA